jgi:hypothetical protein
MEHYQRLMGGQPKIADLLAMPVGAEPEFDPPKARIESRATDLA